MRYFEDLHPGQRASAGPFVLTRDAIVYFAREWDPAPYHVDEAHAETSLFGGLTAAGSHLFAIFTKLVHRLDRPVAVVALLETTVELPRPARPGDELSLTSEIASVRPSKSRPDCGVVSFVNTLSRDGEAVLVVRSVCFVARRER